MPKPDVKKLMHRSLNGLMKEFNWPKQTRNRMVCLVHGCTLYSFQRKGRAGRRDLDELGGMTKLIDVFRILEKEYAQIFPANDDYHRRSFSKFNEKYQSWLKLFTGMGLTRLDSIILPQKTVTLELLQEIPKKKLLKMDARVLGTLANRALEGYCFIEFGGCNGLKHTFPTIKTLLTAKPIVSKRTIVTTRKLLRKLGFNYDDGVFMQEDTMEEFIDDLMENELLSQKEAKMFARIAVERGWVKVLAN